MTNAVFHQLPKEQQQVLQLATELSQQELYAADTSDLSLKSSVYQDSLVRFYRLQDKCLALKNQAEQGCAQSQLMLESMSSVAELCVADVVTAAEEFLQECHSNIVLFQPKNA